jgi:hypothetical protein
VRTAIFIVGREKALLIAALTAIPAKTPINHNTPVNELIARQRSLPAHT